MRKKYIDADKLIVEIKRYKNKADERLKIKGRTFGVEQKDLALQNLCGNLLYFITSLQQDETQVDKMLCSQVWWEDQGWIMIPPDATIEGIDSLLRQVRKKLQQEQPKKRLIQVKCLYPYDESWQKNKVYTCEVWHHGDLNRDFWDVYYDYGKDPKYVQFPTIELLNEEFVIIQEESQVKQEQPELSNEFEIAINRRLNLINGENLTATELLEETKGMAAELLDLACKVIEKEQPEVDLENEFADFLEKENAYVDDNNKISYYNGGSFDHTCDIYPIARHFYELGLKARKEN